jgi:hypothetical protein
MKSGFSSNFEVEAKTKFVVPADKIIVAVSNNLLSCSNVQKLLLQKYWNFKIANAGL